MAGDPRSLTRRELYELVWKTPVDRLAKEFGLSGRGLGKLCDRHGIPVPPRGYWAQKPAAQKALRQTLIEVEAPTRDRSGEAVLAARPARPTTSAQAQGPSEYLEMFSSLVHSIGPISVPKTLHGLHPVIQRIWDEDQREARDRDPLLARLGPTRYASAIARRELRIASALFRTLEAHGFKVRRERYDKAPYRASKDGVEVSFRIFERENRVRRALTDKERAESWNQDQKWKFEISVSGEIRVQIKSHLPAGVPQEWVDKEGRTVDESITEISAAAIVAVAFEKDCQARRREAEQRRWEQEREAARIAEERRQERARRKALAMRARLWREAADIRAYVADVLRRQGSINGSVGDPDVQKWKTWALGVADEMDPIVRGEAISTRTPVELDEEANSAGRWR